MASPDRTHCLPDPLWNAGSRAEFRLKGLCASKMSGASGVLGGSPPETHLPWPKTSGHLLVGIAQCSDRLVEIRLGFANCLQEPPDQCSIQLNSGVSITAPTPVQQQVLRLRSGLISTNSAKDPKLLISHPDLRHACPLPVMGLNLGCRFEGNVATARSRDLFAAKWSIEVKQAEAMNA
jgi:hypothetical protein